MRERREDIVCSCTKLSTLPKRILVCSSVRKDPQIVECFLWGLSNLDRCGCHLDFHFVDDCCNRKSSLLLCSFKPEGSEVIVEEEDTFFVAYETNEYTHIWTREAVSRVVSFKNRQIEYALKKGYDYVLFVDADVIVHPDTLSWLLKAEKDIVSEVYWTKWRPDADYMPQVWYFDNYSYVIPQKGETQKELTERVVGELEKLRRPGLYRVGGLGALTLISRKALKAGVNFSPIYNISWVGEDRHFCVRAVALGFELYADTHAPAFHIYRSEDLKNVRWYMEYLEKYRNDIFFPPNRIIRNNEKVVLMMPVRNEAGKVLERCLEAVKGIIDAAVVWDDCSEDSTPDIVANMLKGVELHLIRATSRFKNEKLLREALWQETLKADPGFILALDADEVVDGLDEEITTIKNTWRTDTWGFRLFDMWDEEHYREDEFWQAHKHYRAFLFRYQPLSEYTFVDKPLHMGRFPQEVLRFPVGLGRTRVLHYGYARPEWREEKYRKYKELDPDAERGIKMQYESILDPNPTLKPIKEAK